MREQIPKDQASSSAGAGAGAAQTERNFEGGFGGLEDLEDRYATTSGEH